MRGTESGRGEHGQRWWSARWASFGFAWRGIRLLVLTQPNAQVHLVVSALVIAVALALEVERWEWVALALATGLVWTAEALNTACEFLVDLLHPAWHPDAGRVKDVAAGAVLLATLCAVGTGLLVFAPHLYRLLTGLAATG